ncbi:MAG TPA: hypothetical protein VFZ95_03210 [Steroidobacteraceae bacterium]
MQATASQPLTLRIVGAAGAILFAFFFALTWHTPRWVEDFAAGYIEGRVAHKLDNWVDGLGPPAGHGALSRYAAGLYRQNEQKIAGYKALLKRDIREQLAICIPQVRALSDELRARLESWVRDGAEFSIGELQLDNSRLVALIQSGYLAVVADLTHDVRIFAASNAIAFLVLLLVSFLKPGHVRELFVPGVLLAISTLACAWLYVFEQDWLMTIVQGSYLGAAYTAWLGISFLFLCDVWLNNARVTARVLEGLASVFATAIPL